MCNYNFWERRSERQICLAQQFLLFILIIVNNYKRTLKIYKLKYIIMAY